MIKYLFLDTETGGLNTSYSLLTAYFVALDEKFNILGELDLKIKPNKGGFVTTAEALKKNRINLEEHAKTAISESEASEKLKNFLYEMSNNGEEKLIPSGHNIPFDLSFIMAKLLHEKEWYGFCSKQIQDTTQIGMFLKLLKILPINLPNSLESYAEYYGLPRKNLHDARNDVILNVAVYKKMQMGRLSIDQNR